MKNRLALALLCSLALVALFAHSALAWDPAYADQRANFAKAVQALAANDRPTAEPLFNDLAGSDWPAADEAAIRLLELAQDDDDQDTADRWRAYLIDRFPHSHLRPQAMLNLAEHRIDQGNPADAKALLERYFADYPNAQVDRASFLLGTTLADLGQSAEAAAALARAAYWFVGPNADRARSRLAELNAAGVKSQRPDPDALWAAIGEQIRVNYWITAELLARRYAALFPGDARAFDAELVAVDCLFARRKYRDAKTRVQWLAKRARTADEKLAVAVLLKRLTSGVTADQKAAYFERAAAKPPTSLAAYQGKVALLVLAGEQGDVAATAKWADALIEHHAARLFRPADVFWQAAFAHYLLGDYTRAADLLAQWIAAYPAHPDVDRAMYWLARARQRAEQGDEAERAYRRCFDRWQGTYYGLAAQVRLAQMGVTDLPSLPFTASPETADGSLPTLLPEWRQENGGGTADETTARAAIDAYIAGAPAGLAAAFRAARELIAVQELEAADARLTFITDAAYQTPDGPYFLSLARALTGDNLESIRAAQRAFEQVREGRLADPFALTTYRRFPYLYAPLVRQAAKAHAVDPFLVMAIVKQESAFQIDARSWVGARGLMQVMPGTGRYIAKRRGIRNFNPAKLYEPETSLDYGCWLISYLLAHFDGDLPATLAGYNAGWGRPPKWWAPHVGRNYDEVIELIPFDETRGYVKAILRNYEMYQRLYVDGEGGVQNRPNVLNILLEDVKAF